MKNAFSFICPPLVVVVRFQKQFLTTYGGQIEEKRVFCYLPTIRSFVCSQKQFLTTYGGQIEEKRVLFYLPTITCLLFVFKNSF